MNRRRKLLRSFAAALTVIGGVLVLAAPAYAHHPVPSGTSVCSDGDHVITWTIGNSEPHDVMIVNPESNVVLHGVTYGLTLAEDHVPGGGATTATTVIPGGLTGDVVLTVHAHWADGFAGTRTYTLTLGATCSATTTSTPPSSEPSTTTSSAPETSTTMPATSSTVPSTVTSTVPGTSTTVASPSTTSSLAPPTTDVPSTATSEVIPHDTTTTHAATTTTAARVGPPVEGGQPPSGLPFTGAPLVGETLIGAGLALFGAALCVPKRRRT